MTDSFVVIVVTCGWQHRLAVVDVVVADNTDADAAPEDNDNDNDNVNININVYDADADAAKDTIARFMFARSQLFL